MKSALIHGSYLTRNFGDLLLAELAAQRIQKNGFHALCPWLLEEVSEQVSFSSGNGLIEFLFGRPLIFGGGGYVSSNGGSRRALRWALPALTTRLRGARYIIVAPGSDDYIPDHLKKYYRLLFENATFANVRDVETLSALRNVGVTKQIDVTIDTAVAVESKDIPEFNKWQALEVVQEKDVLLLNIPQASGQLLSEFVKKVSALTRTSGIQRVWLYENEPFNLSELREALAAYDLAEDAVLYHQDMWTVAAIIERCKAVLTTQLHVGIVAYALGVATCSLSAHQKTKRFYAQIGRSHWQVDIKMNDSGRPALPEEVCGWLQAIVEGSDDFFDLDLELMTHNKRLAERNLALIDSFLSSLS